MLYKTAYTGVRAFVSSGFGMTGTSLPSDAVIVRTKIHIPRIRPQLVLREGPLACLQAGE